MKPSTCAFCGLGSLAASRVRRMRPAVVAIGHLGAAVMLTSAFLAFVGVIRLGEMPTPSTVRSDLTSAGVSESITERVFREEAIPQPEFVALTEPQRWAVDQARRATSGAMVIEMARAMVRVSCGIGFIVFLAGGLMALLLTLRTDALRCSSCGTLVLGDLGSVQAAA